MDSERIESEIRALHSKLDEVLDLVRDRREVKEFYTTQEVGQIVGRDMFTVREWARNGRILATKRRSGRGKASEWAISHEELQRIRNHGLLPDARRQAD